MPGVDRPPKAVAVLLETGHLERLTLLVKVLTLAMQVRVKRLFCLELVHIAGVVVGRDVLGP